MTKKNLKDLIKKLVTEVISEEDITGTDDDAVVQSDKLTATLAEDNDENIKDLEKLLANPDPSRAKDYGSIEKYKKMLKQKILRLKAKKSVDEAILNKAKAIAKKKKVGRTFG